MGGRGSSSASSSTGAIGRAKPISVRNERSLSGGNRWRYTVLEAKASGKGITVGYPEVDHWENPNRNTTYAHYKLKAGFYNGPGSRSIETHNVDLSKAEFVEGKTYDIKDKLRAAGFKWDRKNKRWIR